MRQDSPPSTHRRFPACCQRSPHRIRRILTRRRTLRRRRNTVVSATENGEGFHVIYGRTTFRENELGAKRKTITSAALGLRHVLCQGVNVPPCQIASRSMQNQEAFVSRCRNKSAPEAGKTMKMFPRDWARPTQGKVGMVIQVRGSAETWDRFATAA